MQLKITNESRIKDIQDQFSSHFPYLKIEFFRIPHTIHKLSAKEERVEPRSQIAELSNKHKPALVDIDHQTTVADLENELSIKFGLSAQVFRKSGKLWIETSLTDGWTLDKQNKEGELFSKPSDDGHKYDQPENDKDVAD